MANWKSDYNKTNEELKGKYKEKHHLRSLKEVYIMLAVALALIVFALVAGA